MRALLTALALSTTSLAIGCSNPIEDLDEVVDCGNICDRYRDCYDTEYDTEACRDRCDELTTTEGEGTNTADACDACLDDRSCVDATFTCATECAGILP